jgi:hypothetical protein
MGCDPGVEFSKRLLEVSLEIRVKDVNILTEDFITE